MTDRFDEIQGRLRAATPGPWEWIGTSLEQCSPGYGEVIEAEVDCMRYCYGGSPRLNISAANKALIEAAPTDMAALLGAVRAVLNLHKPERRWMPYEGADVSFDTEKEAYEALDDVDVNQVVLAGIAANGLPYFEVCAHCKTVEEGACEGECTKELGYLTSLWPCPTVAAINEALEGK